jgi:hypothetical protein
MRTHHQRWSRHGGSSGFRPVSVPHDLEIEDASEGRIR